MFSTLRNTGILPWLLLFVVVNFSFHHSAGTNSDSRFALLCALVEDQSLRIDRYQSLTSDWARTPDGHYYSNKAPGPVLLALPLFSAVDHFVTRGLETREARDELRQHYKARLLKLLSWIFQVLPFAFLVGLVAFTLLKSGVSPVATHFAVVAMLFGNTAAFFMNTYYGHGATAVWVLGAALALWYRRGGWFGFCLGWAVLCDYGSFCLLPPALFAWGLRDSKKVFLGALFPFFLWVVYHQSCFGSPFTLANRFQNPLFLDLVDERYNLWGVLTLPRLSVLEELLWGPSRGLFPTQPWLLPTAVLWLFHRGPGRSLGLFALGSLSLLLLMNASFGGWHGGLTPGARYLSAVLPLFGWLLGLCWDRWSRNVKFVQAIALAASVVFFILVFSNHITPPLVPLWRAYTYISFTAPSATTQVRLFLLFPLFAATVVWISRQSRLRWKPTWEI